MDFSTELEPQTFDVTIKNVSSHFSENGKGNFSLQENCLNVIFSEMEFLPWDNPDNIISAEDENMVRRIKDNVLFLLFLIGGPVNVINMAVFYKQGLKDRVNLCLFALSLADELYLIAALLHYGEQLYIQFTTKERFGPVLRFLANNNLVVLTAFCFISPILSAIIAIERCLCVFNPLKFQTLLRTRTMAFIIIGVYAVVLGLIFVVVFRYRLGCVYDPEVGAVFITTVEGEFYKAHKAFIDPLDSFVFGSVLPMAEMIVVTTTTILTIVKLRQAASWRSGSSSSISPREVAVTKMLVGNSILFIICITPISLNRFRWLPEVNAEGRNQNFFLAALWINEIFTYINATFNFFVYYAMGSRFRETCWELLGRKISSQKS